MPSIDAHAANDAASVNFGARNVLYVEGDLNGFDVRVMNTLLRDVITVKSATSCGAMRAAARSFVQSEPGWFFLVDRDYGYKDKQVKDVNDKFIKKAKDSNVIILHAKEIENCFLLPDLLIKSSFIKCKKDVLASEICNRFEKCLFFAAAQIAVSNLLSDNRNMMKSAAIVQSHCSRFKSAQDHLKSLIRSLRVDRKIQENRIENEFQRCVELLSGNVTEKLKYGSGKWMERIGGKVVYKQIVSRFFTVKNSDGNTVSGNEAEFRVAEDLVRSNIVPDELMNVRKIITERIS